MKHAVRKDEGHPRSHYIGSMEWATTLDELIQTIKLPIFDDLETVDSPGQPRLLTPHRPPASAIEPTCVRYAWFDRALSTFAFPLRYPKRILFLISWRQPLELMQLTPLPQPVGRRNTSCIEGPEVSPAELEKTGSDVSLVRAGVL